MRLKKVMVNGQRGSVESIAHDEHLCDCSVSAVYCGKPKPQESNFSQRG